MVLTNPFPEQYFAIAIFIYLRVIQVWYYKNNRFLILRIALEGGAENIKFKIYDEVFLELPNLYFGVGIGTILIIIINVY